MIEQMHKIIDVPILTYFSEPLTSCYSKVGRGTNAMQGKPIDCTSGRENP
jgi:hypothetical protein